MLVYLFIYLFICLFIYLFIYLLIFRMELCLLVVVSKLDALLSVTNSRKMATPRFKLTFHFSRYNET